MELSISPVLLLDARLGVRVNESAHRIPKSSSLDWGDFSEEEQRPMCILINRFPFLRVRRMKWSGPQHLRWMNERLRGA